MLLQFMSKSVLPVFSSRTSVVSSLTFRPLILNLFLYFIYGVRKCSNLILQHTAAVSGVAQSRTRLKRLSSLAATEIRSIVFFAAKDGEGLYSEQEQDWELTVAQIMNSLLPNSYLN